MDFICQESKRYASEKGFYNFSVTVEELYLNYAIVISSGYVLVASRRMYWEKEGDTSYSLLSSTMSRNKFESIHRSSHFCDNDIIDKNDKAAKMRIVLDYLDRIFTECIQPLGTHFSLDEAIEPSSGRHSMKQFIRDDYLIKFVPYLAAGDELEGKTLGSSVTEKICLNFILRESIVFIDNYFNCLPSLETLSKHQLCGIGTIPSARVKNASMYDVKKGKHGSNSTLYDKKTLTRWYDRSRVNLATNLNDKRILEIKSSCTRWSKKDRSKIAVEQPSIINFQSKGIGE
ncbi:hypothetical protein JTB14_009383 [Gonioctena quinquepunctata]|nr:hypothetical protein JTB14_009383 [Gonioctena quinquepunctata]